MINKIESKTARKLNEAERIKNINKRSNLEKDYNKAQKKIIKGYK